MYKGPAKILSDNSKTIVSLNLPVKGHCRPTTLCLQKCYARTGHVAFPFPVRKQRWLSQYLSKPEIGELIHECRAFRAIRISGTGDLKNAHIPQILRIAQECPHTEFWGMTRKTEIANALTGKYPNLRMLVSIDSTSPKKVLNFDGALCWGPRMPEDVIPDDSRIKVFFPFHKSGKVLKTITRLPKDCPGVWHEVKNCLECQKCWTYV